MPRGATGTQATHCKIQTHVLVSQCFEGLECGLGCALEVLCIHQRAVAVAALAFEMWRGMNASRHHLVATSALPVNAA